MPTVAIGQVVAEVAGDGEPVIMVHGLGGTSNTWQPQMATLEAYRAIRVDLPGSGRSPAPHGALDIADLADAVVKAARGLGVARAHFVGHSLGTIVCQHIAVNEPALVASLALFGAITEPPTGARSGLIDRARKARTEGMEGIADAIVAGALSSATRADNPAAVAFVRESVMRQSPEAYATSCEALSRATAADPAGIRVAVLLVAGSDDQVAPVSMAQGLADRLSDASLSVVDRCGHWITIERAGEASRKLGDFLQRQRI